jgi:hypothetical protein
MKTIIVMTFLCCCLFLAGCQTSDATLRDQGRSDAYVVGFHDGRHSGMQEAGNFLEHFIQDQARFESDLEYRKGWLAGETEGKRIQQEANAAVGVYSSYKIGQEVDKATDFKKIGKDAVKDADTSALKSLEKN